MIEQNILNVKAHISKGCAQINCDPDSIKIVAVSKGRSPELIGEVIGAGITDIGENRVQEAIGKYNAIRNTQYAIRTKWHMVGHLQTNKVKQAVKIFDLIQSVDSVHLAQEIDKEAGKINKIQDVLIEVKTSPEATKFGLRPEDTIEAIKEITKFQNIKIKGLMTIAPVVDNPEQTRPYFRKLRNLLEEIKAICNTGEAPRILSMGMTDDFEVAIEEGANMVRIGRAIFESL